jgi:tRNA threonylcarbamoyladenosine biosynthesis protein TsaE
MELLFDYKDIPLAAEAFWKQCGDVKVIVFRGQMGAGKTTFIHALCDLKQVNGPVSSPTFPIINEYSYPGGKIFHIDLYRLKDAEEAIRAGVEDCLYSGEICLVEWPEKAPSIFPDDSLHVYLEVINALTRKLTFGPIA